MVRTVVHLNYPDDQPKDNWAEQKEAIYNLNKMHTTTFVNNWIPHFLPTHPPKNYVHVTNLVFHPLLN
jgi:hypothetical protein